MNLSFFISMLLRFPDNRWSQMDISFNLQFPLLRVSINAPDSLHSYVQILKTFFFTAPSPNSSAVLGYGRILRHPDESRCIHINPAASALMRLRAGRKQCEELPHTRNANGLSKFSGWSRELISARDGGGQGGRRLDLGERGRPGENAVWCTEIFFHSIPTFFKTSCNVHLRFN